MVIALRADETLRRSLRSQCKQISFSSPLPADSINYDAHVSLLTNSREFSFSSISASAGDWKSPPQGLKVLRTGSSQSALADFLRWGGGFYPPAQANG